MVALIPPDFTRCQALVPTRGPWVLGGRCGDPRDGYRRRCDNVPVILVIERECASDGQYGSMTLCARCAEEFVKTGASANVRTSPIKSEGLDT